MGVRKGWANMELAGIIEHQYALFVGLKVVGTKVQRPSESRAERASRKRIRQQSNKLRHASCVCERPNRALPELHEQPLLNHPDELVWIAARGHLFERREQQRGFLEFEG